MKLRHMKLAATEEPEPLFSPHERRGQTIQNSREHTRTNSIDAVPDRIAALRFLLFGPISAAHTNSLWNCRRLNCWSPLLIAAHRLLHRLNSTSDWRQRSAHGRFLRSLRSRDVDVHWRTEKGAQAPTELSNGILTLLFSLIHAVSPSISASCCQRSQR